MEAMNHVTIFALLRLYIGALASDYRYGLAYAMRDDR
jgi:hypothetical protein